MELATERDAEIELAPSRRVASDESVMSKIAQCIPTSRTGVERKFLERPLEILVSKDSDSQLLSASAYVERGGEPR